MRSRVTVGVFSIMIAVCSLSIGGCSGNNTESTVELYKNNIGQLSNNSEFSAMSENSESSSDNSHSDIVLGTPPLSSGEPTILIGLDGEPILTSEITEIYDIRSEPTTVDALTPDNIGASAICEGFQYFKEPEGTAYDNYHNPELFEGMEYIGEKPENKSEWKRVNVGEEICGLRLVKAATRFEIYEQELVDTYYIHGGLNRATAEFEGTVTIEGFMSSDSRSLNNPTGGTLRFTPTENKLPLMGNDLDIEPMFGVSTAYETRELLCYNELHQIQIGAAECDTNGLGVGDIAYVRAELGNIRYRAGYMVADLKGMELLSDMLVHVDDYI